jgi:hypothetical protein
MFYVPWFTLPARRVCARLAIAGTLLALTACAGTSPLAPAAGVADTVDVLDFIVGDASTWPRTGTQHQTQIVDRAAQSVCWVKYGRSDMFECWRWDDDWVYHVVDHAVDGESGESYSFSDGRWLPRRLTGEWSINLPDNRIRWFDRDCALFAWIEPARDAGALGVHDVLVLEYGPHLPSRGAASTERFYFARGFGWYRWESSRGMSTFDVAGGPAMTWHSPGCTPR